jgi:uncharacterized protein
MALKLRPLQEDAINLSETSYLFIRKSQMEGCGNGLFTAIDIYKDEIISYFKGEILSDAQAKKRAEKGRDGFFISLLDGKIMDSRNTKCFAKYANDAKGVRRFNFKNNAKITLDDNEKICLIAIKKIKVGEEIFCGYGKRYWRKYIK